MTKEHATVGGGVLTVGPVVETKPLDPTDRIAYDDCLKALWQAPNEYGRSLYLALLTDAPDFSSRDELRLLVALVQRIALRRGWMKGVSL